MRRALLGLVSPIVFVALAAIAPGCSAKNSYGDGDPDGAVEEDVLPTDGLELTKGLAVSEVAVMQGPKVIVAKDGAPVSATNSPVIIGRPGAIRVYVRTDPDWVAREVVGKLTLSGAAGSKRYTVKKSVFATSTDDAWDSTFNFVIDPGIIAADTGFSIELLTEKGQTSEGSPDGARFPASATSPLGATSTGEKLQIMIVPIKYQADGSGRLPDTSPDQIELYRRHFMRVYPARQVEVLVRPTPFTWSSAINRSGAGFDSILNAIISLRQKDGAAKGIYYYGAFMPAASFAAFCGGGCVAGLSPLAMNPGDTWTAASVGLGFTGDQTADTCVHEVGHGHGRQHSPCSPGGFSLSGVDPAYPYSGAKIGPVSYDVVDNKLVTAGAPRDFMSYCDPKWVSDWTYRALAKRMAYVYEAYEIPGPTLSYQILNVKADGSMEFGPSVDTQWGPRTDGKPVKVELADGTTVDTIGHYFEYDHLPGGMLIVPTGKPGATRVRAVSVENLRLGIKTVRALAP